jgi:hypothetical protein
MPMTPLLLKVTFYKIIDFPHFKCLFVQVTTFPVPTVGCHISISFPAGVDLLNFLEVRLPIVTLSAEEKPSRISGLSW